MAYDYTSIYSKKEDLNELVYSFVPCQHSAALKNVAVVTTYKAGVNLRLTSTFEDQLFPKYLDR